MDEPLSNDGRGIFALCVLALAAMLYFGLPQFIGGWPPSYVQVGPVEFGQLADGNCHGIRNDGEMVAQVCK